MGVIGAISDLLQTREDGLRLLIAVLLGYPAAAVYRTFLYDKAPRIQHLYFVVVGIFLHFFFCGAAVWHTLLSIVLAYGITNFIPGTTASVVAAHVAFLGHLLVGYWFSESDKYDITWTTPFCIISLKHIGLVMDVYDGRHFEKLKPDQKLTAIKDSPDLLEVAGFTLFFSGTLVGGQFTLARFRAFVNGEYLDPLKKEVRATSLMPSLGRFVAACFYMVIHQWGAVWIPSEYLNSPEFFALSFWWKLIWITLFFRFTMYRYCSAWLYAEGAAILSGVAYNGQKDGKDQWDGVRDMHITGWELGRDFNSVIASFNVGTNTFAKNHIFRRLRWLNSKLGAQFATLMYLAVWHGYHLGYFLLFIYEMITMLAQEQLYSLINRTPGGNEFFAQAWVRPITWVFGRVVINVSMAFAFLTFGLVKKEIWIGPVKSLYFCGYIFYIIIWPITYQILLRVLPRKPKETKDAKDVVPNEQVKETKKEL